MKESRVIADDCAPPDATFKPLLAYAFGSLSTKVLISKTKYGYFIRPKEVYPK
mgnify:CR=1 FL=1|uniref:Uncharacterized protein n=1 Tax=viral metagenome TaxID=1070528 RepID=A0A6C0J726_9ZZZZ